MARQVEKAAEMFNEGLKTWMLSWALSPVFPRYTG